MSTSPSDDTSDEGAGHTHGEGNDSTLRQSSSDVDVLTDRQGLAESIVNSLPFISAIIAEDGRIVATNSAWQALAAKTVGTTWDFTSENLFDACRRASAAGDSTAAETLEGVLAVARGDSYQTQRNRPNSSSRTRQSLRLHATRVDGDGRLLIIAHDDSESVPGMSSPTQLDYYPVFENSPIPMLIAHRETDHIQVVNGAMAALVEIDRGTISGKTPVEIGLITAPILAAIHKTAPEGQPLYGSEFACRLHDGEQRTFLHRTESVEFRGMLCYLLRLIEITEHVRVEQAHQAALHKYTKLYDSIIDGFVSVAMDGRILEFNDSYRTMLGYERDELLAMTYADLTPARWHAVETNIVTTQVLRDGHSSIYEKEYQRKDGTIFPVELRTMLIRDDAGEPKLMWAIVRDITDRNKAENTLLELNRKIEIEHTALTNKHEALREVLNHIEDEKGRAIAYITANIEKVIAPMIRQLQKSSAGSPQQRKLVDQLKQALDEISSPFVGSLNHKFSTLSPRELQICTMVKNGIQSKEIAELLGISVLTVSTIRQQIRSKLSIENEKVGLAEYLRAFK